MNKPTGQVPLRRAVIIAYTNRSSFAFLRWLRPGFRHCIAISAAPPYWVLVDPISNKLSHSVLDLKGLADYLVTLHQYGYRCQLTYTIRSPRREISIMPYTCTEAVKRTLGLVSYRIWTPYQLFKHIKKNILTT